MHRNPHLLLLPIALVGIVASVHADTTIYTDKQLFLDATKAIDSTGPLPNLGFRGNQATTLGTVTLLPVAGHGLRVGTAGTGLSDWTALLPGNDICLDDTEEFDVSFAPCHAFGFDIVEPTADTYGEFIESTFTITLFSEGLQVAQFEYQPPNDSTAFVGAWADALFDRVSIRETVGGGNDEYFGHFYTGNIPPDANERLPIPGLRNTGVDLSGNRLANGSLDPNYTQLSGPINTTHWMASAPNGLWAGNTEGSAWITPTGNGSESHAAGFYELEQTFDLSGFDPASVHISGRWIADNAAELFLNGSPTGITLGSGAFSSWGTFSLNSGFRRGENSLTFRVENFTSGGFNPVGLRVEFTEFSGIPEGNLSQREFAIDPAATYLRVAGDPDAKHSLVIDLAANGYEPGMLLMLERLGSYAFAPATPQDYTGIQMIAVFSANEVLEDNPGANPPLRVPGRIATTVPAFATPLTHFGSNPTDIDGDFYVQRVVVSVPVGASHLFVSSNDEFFGDNLTNPSDPLRLRITRILDPNKDTDGDGFSDHFEILSGSSPSDPASAFRHAPEFDGAFSTSFTGLAGRRYALERTSGLVSGIWVEVAGTALLAGEGLVVLEDPDPDPPPSAFYRIAISLQ